MLFLSLFCGCDNDNSLPLYNYDLELRFEDLEGKDLVTGILYIENSKSDNTYVVEGITYQLSSDISEKMPNSLYVVKRKEYESLLFKEGTPGKDKRKSEITYYFKCSHIFGDDTVHTIKTYWDNSGMDKYNCYCKYVELNGRRYPAVYDENEYVSKVTVQLP
jgi:hypothetical protein